MQIPCFFQPFMVSGIKILENPDLEFDSNRFRNFPLQTTVQVRNMFTLPQVSHSYCPKRNIKECFVAAYNSIFFRPRLLLLPIN
jgi:hypothetical protein